MRADVLQQGFDERFVCMGQFDLSYCEAGFDGRSIGTAHAVIERSIETK